MINLVRYFDHSIFGLCYWNIATAILLEYYDTSWAYLVINIENDIRIALKSGIK